MALVLVAQKLAAFHFLIPLLHGLVFHCAAMGMGALVLHFLTPLWRNSLEQWVWGWAVGLGLFGTVQFFAAHLFVFGPQVAILLYFSGLASWLVLFQQNRSGLHKFVRGIVGIGKEPWLLVSCIIGFVLVLGTVTPPMFWDSNVYHLARPMQYLLWEGAEISPHHTFSANPLLIELALSPVLILSFDPIHMNVAHGMGLFLLLGCAALYTRRFLTEKHYGVAALSLLSMPVVVFTASAMKSDLYTAVFVCGVIFVLTLLERNEQSNQPPMGLFVVLGLFAGCGAATRYHGALFLVVILGGSLCFGNIRQVVFQKRNLFLFLGSGIFFGALFFFQNALLFSNPTHPFLDTFWGTGELTQRFTETYRREKYFSGLSADHLLQLPLILIYDIIDGDMNDVLGFMPIVALAFTTLHWHKMKSQLRFVFLLLCCTLPFWLLSSPRARYLPLLWLVVSFASSAGFAALEKKSHQIFASGLLLLTLFVSLSWNLQADEKLLGHRAKYIFGHQDRETYLKGAYGPYDAYDFINRTLPQEAVIFMMGDNRAAYLERRAFLSGVYVTPHHETLMKASQSSMQLQQKFKETGATHLLISHEGLKRLEDWGWGQWSAEQQGYVQKMIQRLGAPLFAKKGWVLYAL